MLREALLLSSKVNSHVIKLFEQFLGLAFSTLVLK